MKIVLDFDTPRMMQLTSTDDKENYYSMAWNGDKFSLWYNGNIFWEYEYEDLSLAIGAIVGLILRGMVVKAE